MMRLTRLLRDRRGIASVEFGAVGATLALCMIGIVDVGNMLRLSMQAKYAAQAGASYAFINGFSASGIAAAVASSARAGVVAATPDPSQFYGCAADTGIAVTQNATQPCSGTTVLPGLYVKVQTAVNFSPIFNAQFLSYPSTLTATSIVRVQ